MSQTITPFHQDEFDLALIIEGDTFRVLAPQSARSLGFRSASDMLRSVPAEEKGDEIVHTSGGPQTVGYVTEEGFYRVLGQQQAARIKDLDVRDRVERFQSWLFREVLPEIRRATGGSYTSPAQSAPTPQNEQFEYAKQMLELCQKAQELVQPDFLAAKVQIIMARAMGKRPPLDYGSRPLYVPTYLQERGVLQGSDMNSMFDRFGELVKASYIAKHGKEPGKYPGELINGQIHDVYGYTEADRPLLDKVWIEHFTF